MGHCMSAIKSIGNYEDAREFYEGYATWNEAHKPSPDYPYSGEEIAKANIGYCFGEGMASERIQMWREVTGAEHPYGPGIENATPTELFEAGQRMAEQA